MRRAQPKSPGYFEFIVRVSRVSFLSRGFRTKVIAAEFQDANLTLLHVFEESYSFDKEIGLRAVELLGVKKSNAERELALIEGHLGAQYPKCRSCFRVGTPFEQIVREAENIGANLIVMSCHSYGWPDRILHGSDAEGVLRVLS